MRTVLPLLLVVAIIPASAAAGRDIFVDNLAGNDTYTGELALAAAQAERTGPVRSINKALRLAQQGDRIVLAARGAPYRECIALVGKDHGGSSLRPFVIEGNGAILDGSAPVPAIAWEHFDGPVFRFRPPKVGHQQLFLNDRPAPQVTASTLADGPPELEPLQWCLQASYIYFCVEWGKLPEDYPLTFAEKQTGITLFHVRDVVIANLTVQGFQLDAINAHNSARNVVLRGVTCRGNGRAGVAVGGASLVELDACGLGDNGAAQLLVLPWSETHVRNSVLLDNTAPPVVRQGGDVFIDGQEMGGETMD